MLSSTSSLLFTAFLRRKMIVLFSTLAVFSYEKRKLRNEMKFISTFLARNSTLLKFGNITKYHTGEAIRGMPGYIIYYKLDKYKEIRRYISIYNLQSINTILLKYRDNIGVKF